MKETISHAIALCRVSTKSQLLDGNLEPQEERIIQAAAILNVKVVQWWKLAVSSRKGKNLQRKDILEMYDFCKANRKVKFLIADEVDRFMRSISEYYYWKVMFQNIGVELRHANRPDADPTEDRAVFDELIDVYRAESSNNERITKTPEKMMAKIKLGYYPSNPHSGYKKSDVPGLHIPDEPNWSALRDTFKEMASGVCTVEEGLKQAHERGFRTKNYGPKAIGGREIDMFRWKAIMSDPYYCGIVKMTDWPVVNDKGLHQPMITKQEHQILVELVLNKGKKYIRHRNNPKYPFSNLIDCEPCTESGSKGDYPRIVGSDQHNGRKGEKRRYYERYWCRSCSKGVPRQELHDQIDLLIKSFRLSDEQVEQTKLYIRQLWEENERVRIEQMVKAERNLLLLKQKKNNLIANLDMKSKLHKDMEEAIEAVKQEIDTAELTLAQSKDYDHDFNEFLAYALDLTSSWVNDFWSQDKATMAKCKNLLFSGVLMLNKDRNVYTPVKSLVYCLAAGEEINVEVDDNDQLHPILTEVLRWRTIIGPEYQQYVLNTFRHSLVQAV